jgi:peroxiredoxin
MGGVAMSLKICKKQPGDTPLPNFTLESIDGAAISLWDFRDRYNVVIMFFDPSRSTDLHALSLFGMKDPEFADANAEVLAIAEDPDEHAIAHMKNMSIPFHILKDPGATVRTKLNIKDSPSVAVLDRYGMLLMLCSKCENANETLEDIISELLTLEMQCPECGVSSWRMDY